MAKEPEEPRAHHWQFKLWFANAIIQTPAQVGQDLLGPDGSSVIHQAWTSFGNQFPPEEQVDPTGLRLHVFADIPPTVVIELPVPERSNEAHSLAVVWLSPEYDPAVLFALEKSAAGPAFGPPGYMLVAFTERGRMTFGPRPLLDPVALAAEARGILRKK